MSSDIEEFIEDEMRYARTVLGGDTPTPRQFGEHFLRFSPHDRAMKLKAFDKALSSSDIGVETAGKVWAVKRALENADRTARRVGR